MNEVIVDLIEPDAGAFPARCSFADMAAGAFPARCSFADMAAGVFPACSFAGMAADMAAGMAQVLKSRARKVKARERHVPEQLVPACYTSALPRVRPLMAERWR